jgi:hypothetical protein
LMGAGGDPNETMAVRRVEIHASLLPENGSGYATRHE